MAKWKPKLIANYTATSLQNVVSAFKYHTGRFPYKGMHNDISTIIGYYINEGLLNFDINSEFNFIPYRLPVVAEIYRTELVSGENSLLTEAMDQLHEYTTHIVFDAVGKYHDSLFFIKQHISSENTLKSWLKYTNKQDISLIIKTHGERTLLLSNARSFLSGV